MLHCHRNANLNLHKELRLVLSHHSLLNIEIVHDARQIDGIKWFRTTRDTVSTKRNALNKGVLYYNEYFDIFMSTEWAVMKRNNPFIT